MMRSRDFHLMVAAFAVSWVLLCVYGYHKEGWWGVVNHAAFFPLIIVVAYFAVIARKGRA